MSTVEEALEQITGHLDAIADEALARYRAVIVHAARGDDVPRAEIEAALATSGRTPEQMKRDLERCRRRFEWAGDLAQESDPLPELVEHLDACRTAIGGHEAELDRLMHWKILFDTGEFDMILANARCRLGSALQAACAARARLEEPPRVARKMLAESARKDAPDPLDPAEFALS